MKQKMKAHVGTMETQLKNWGAKLDEYVAKADKVSAEAKADYHFHLDDMKAKYQVAQSKLTELKAAGVETWEAVKVGAESAWSDLENAVKKLTH